MKFANDIGHFFAESLVSEQKQRAILLKGFLHKCDYTASGGVECELPNEFLLDKIKYTWYILFVGRSSTNKNNF